MRNRKILMLYLNLLTYGKMDKTQWMILQERDILQ